MLVMFITAATLLLKFQGLCAGHTHTHKKNRDSSDNISQFFFFFAVE
jgi:hypothetical protein